MLLSSGCLSRPPLAKQSFAFPLPPPPQIRSKPEMPGLEIRPLRVADPFDGQSFLYRTGAYSYERDPYAEFLSPPAEVFQDLLRAYLQNSGVFSEVAGQDSALRPDLMAEIHIDDLYGDFRDRAAPKAVLRIRIIFFDAKRDASGKVLWQKDYEERVPLQQRTAAALMAGWNEALGRIMEQLKADLKAELRPMRHAADATR